MRDPNQFLGALFSRRQTLHLWLSYFSTRRLEKRDHASGLIRIDLRSGISYVDFPIWGVATSSSSSRSVRGTGYRPSAGASTTRQDGSCDSLLPSRLVSTLQHTPCFFLHPSRQRHTSDRHFARLRTQASVGSRTQGCFAAAKSCASSSPPILAPAISALRSTEVVSPAPASEPPRRAFRSDAVVFPVMFAPMSLVTPLAAP